MRAAIELPYLEAGIEQVVAVLVEARRHRRAVFFFGNGGSASTASHFVCDIGKAVNPGEGLRIRCVALNDSITSVTAWANDTDYSRVFSEQLVTLAQPGDVAFGISGSGNSPNVLKAMETAKALGMRTIGLTGMGGGKLQDAVQIAIVVPSNSMQHTEDVHLLVCHLLTAYLRDEVPRPGRGGQDGSEDNK